MPYSTACFFLCHQGLTRQNLFQRLAHAENTTCFFVVSSGSASLQCDRFLLEAFSCHSLLHASFCVVLDRKEKFCVGEFLTLFFLFHTYLEYVRGVFFCHAISLSWELLHSIFARIHLFLLLGSVPGCGIFGVSFCAMGFFNLYLGCVFFLPGILSWLFGFLQFFVVRCVFVLGHCSARLFFSFSVRMHIVKLSDAHREVFGCTSRLVSRNHSCLPIAFFSVLWCTACFLSDTPLLRASISSVL